MTGVQFLLSVRIIDRRRRRSESSGHSTAVKRTPMPNRRMARQVVVMQHLENDSGSAESWFHPRRYWNPGIESTSLPGFVLSTWSAVA
jgi:hypothetical protein